MEDTHGEIINDYLSNKFPVLILIIMEDTHGDVRHGLIKFYYGLNPYYNGRYSWSQAFYKL